MARFPITIAAAILLSHVTPVHASPIAPLKADVSYRDLDLATTEGRARLEARIASAARRLCSVDGERDLGRLMSAKACYRSAMASAQPQLAALTMRAKRGVA